MNARLFRMNAVRDLYDRVPINLDLYRSGDFSYLLVNFAIYIESDVKISKKDLVKVDCTSSDYREVENCKLMLSAMGDITPYLARDERLWIYLTHTDLLEYTRKRWPIPANDEDAVDHIRLHFFSRGARGIERDNSASRLWWMANLCGRVDGLSLDEALECLLFRADVRANIIERPSTSQSINVFSGVIKKLHESYKGDQALFERKNFRLFMRKLNLQGGVKLLPALNSNNIANILNGCV